MLIGPLDIQKDNVNNIYIISNLSTCKEHSMFSILVQSGQQSIQSSSNATFTNQYSNLFQLSTMNFNTTIKSIISLNEFSQSTTFTIELATRLLWSMYYQILFLLENNIAISFIDLNDIMVIDSQFFYFCNYEKLYHIKNDKTILVTDFYNVQNPFLPPEFIQNTTIPFSTHYTSSFYSLAIVILYCLHPITTTSTTIHVKTIDSFSHQNMLQTYQQLFTYYHTSKLYNTLKLCMLNNPEHRKLFMF